MRSAKNYTDTQAGYDVLYKKARAVSRYNGLDGLRAKSEGMREGKAGVGLR
jgi:hypothetical protein